jgi:hypothetical protein
VTRSLEHAAASSDDVSRHMIDVDHIHERPVMSLATRPFASQSEIGKYKDDAGACAISICAALAK